MQNQAVPSQRSRCLDTCGQGSCSRNMTGQFQSVSRVFSTKGKPSKAQSWRSLWSVSRNKDVHASFLVVCKKTTVAGQPLNYTPEIPNKPKQVCRDSCSLGCIEVSTSSTKAAKRVVEVGRDDSDEDEVANQAFDKMEKKLRVSSTASTGDDGQTELSLKVPTKSGSDDEELQSILWGDAKMNSCKATSDDDGEVSKTKKARAGGGAGGPSRNKKREFEGAMGGEEGKDSTSWNTSTTRASCKKVPQESRELDKIETLLLQASQLKGQVQDSRTVMQVSVSKVQQLIEKVDAKLVDDMTSMFAELVRREGTDCRAAQVWQSLKTTKEMLAVIHAFVEALQDEEASAATLSIRASKLKGNGMTLPRNVSVLLCKRQADHIVEEGKFDYLFEFLDYNKRSEHPEGIVSLIEETESTEKTQALVLDFQVGCITHCFNSILLKDFQPGEDMPCLGQT